MFSVPFAVIAINAVRIARNRSGATIELVGGVLAVNDPTTPCGWLNGGTNDIRDVGSNVIGCSPRRNHRVLLLVERSSSGPLEHEIHTANLTWVRPLEEELRAALAQPTQAGV